NMLSVAQAHKADFVADEELLDDNLAFGFSKERAFEQAVRGLKRGTARLADEDAFTGSQSVRLDHNGWMKDVDCFFQLCRTGAHGVVSGGNVVSLQESLGETLAGLEHGRFPGGAEYAQAACPKGIDDSQRKRQFRANDGEIRLLRDNNFDH